MDKKGYTTIVSGQKKTYGEWNFRKWKKFLEKYFRMLNLGGSQKAICFWPKKGTFQWQKGYSSTRIEKMGTPPGLGPKKEIRRIFNFARHTLTAVCPFLALNLEVDPFFSIRVELCPFLPLNCTLFGPKTYSLLWATQVEHSKIFSRNFFFT